MTVIPTKQQPAIRTWKASKETGTQTARAVTRKEHRTWLCRQSMRAFPPGGRRSEEHTSEPPSLMRNSYAIFCLKKKQHADPHNEIDAIPTLTHNMTPTSEY